MRKSPLPMAACIIIITMTDAGRLALLRLLTWLSPAFPVGAFAYSHGLERAIHDGVLRDRETLVEWLSDLLVSGSGWNDGVLLAESWREAVSGEPVCTAELAEALAGSRERHMETMLQGEGFAQAVEAWAKATPSGVRSDLSYPVAVGAAAARHNIELEPVLAAYFHAFASNLVQAAVRLIPLGQSDSVAAMAALEPVVSDLAVKASASSLDDLGSATLMSEIMAMRHETQYSRVFRS